MYVHWMYFLGYTHRSCKRNLAFLGLKNCAFPGTRPYLEADPNFGVWKNYDYFFKYNLKCSLTRFLGRPQPQMYPPVAINQYTWVNMGPFLGGPGEPYVEYRGTTVSWRPHHTGYICTTRKNKDNAFFICENINIFGYLGAWGGGGVGFNNIEKIYNRGHLI